MSWVSWGQESVDGYARFGRAEQLHRSNPSSATVPVTLVEDPAGRYSGWLAVGAAAPTLVRDADEFAARSATAFADPEAQGLGRVVRLRAEQRPAA